MERFRLGSALAIAAITLVVIGTFVDAEDNHQTITSAELSEHRFDQYRNAPGPSVDAIVPEDGTVLLEEGAAVAQDDFENAWATLAAGPVDQDLPLSPSEVASESDLETDASVRQLEATPLPPVAPQAQEVADMGQAPMGLMPPASDLQHMFRPSQPAASSPTDVTSLAAPPSLTAVATSPLPPEQQVHTASTLDSSACCFRIGYGSRMVPCCLKVINCTTYEQEQGQPTMGGASGITHGQCPTTAADAATVIQQQKAAQEEAVDAAASETVANSHAQSDANALSTPSQPAALGHFNMSVNASEPLTQEQAAAAQQVRKAKAQRDDAAAAYEQAEEQEKKEQVDAREALLHMMELDLPELGSDGEDPSISKWRQAVASGTEHEGLTDHQQALALDLDDRLSPVHDITMAGAFNDSALDMVSHDLDEDIELAKEVQQKSVLRRQANQAAAAAATGVAAPERGH